MGIETLAGLAVSSGMSLPSVPSRRRANAFDAAGTGRRSRRWIADKQAINSLLFQNAEILRDRSRDAVRKNPHAASAIDNYVAEAIGTGITPLCQHPDPEIRKYVHAKWSTWTKYCDADERTDLYGLQALGVRSMMEAGEVLAHMRTEPRMPRRGVVPLKIRLMEADHLPLTMPTKFADVAEGNFVEYGIEFDSEHRRVAYHLYRNHPGETMYFRGSMMDMSRVPASQMVHMYRSLRPGQMRGQPWLTQVLVLLYELDACADSELMRRKVAAQFAGFIRSPQLEGNPVTEESNNDGNGIAEAELQPGTLQKLLPGEEITFPTVPDSGSFEQTARYFLRSLAVGCGLTYEMLTGDLTGVNYSSIRAGLLAFRRKCEQLQFSVIVPQFCERIWWEWLTVGAISGELKLPRFFEEPDLYEVRWITPGWPWVDPLKDVTAKVMEISNGLSSRSAAIAESGEDIDRIDEENRADKERAEAAGLTYECYAIADPNKQAQNRENRQRLTEKMLQEPPERSGSQIPILQ